VVAPKKIGFPAGLDIGARPLTRASVKIVWRVQIMDHSPGLASTIFITRRYFSKQA